MKVDFIWQDQTMNRHEDEDEYEDEGELGGESRQVPPSFEWPSCPFNH